MQTKTPVRMECKLESSLLNHIEYIPQTSRTTKCPKLNSNHATVRTYSLFSKNNKNKLKVQ